tara:strand:- start:771 stop:1352 length:582 start_codon:yes stop_codon:yes gene_type:complete
MKQQLIVTVSTSIILLFVLFFVIVLPQMNHTKKMQADIETLHTHTQNIYTQRRDLVHPTLHSLAPIFEFTQEIIERQPTRQDQLSIITSLEELGEISGVTQELSVSIEDITKQDDAHFILLSKHNIQSYHRIRITNTGQTQEHLHFLSLLEKLPYRMDIEEMRWTRKKGAKTEEDVTTVTFETKIYIYEKDNS